jgi:GNAT superfamily N-acetyltransferase
MINKYTQISDYRDDKHYRESFNSLALDTFGIDFSAWYDAGGWNDRYVCYSYLFEDRVVSNASVNLMDLVINGQSVKAVQIGTVMTHPEHRGRGLSLGLMNAVIEKYDSQCDFFYLFANETVYDFYPRFGFKRIFESSFSFDIEKTDYCLQNTGVKKLNTKDAKDFELLKNLTVGRIPVSETLGIINEEHLVIFHCFNTFADHIYYLEDEELIVIFRHDGNKLKIYDIISRHRTDVRNIINRLIKSETEKVLIFFTPDWDNERIRQETDESSELFIRPGDYDICNGKGFVFPVTSQA